MKKNLVQPQDRKALKLAKSTLKNLTVKSGVKAGNLVTGASSCQHRCG